MTPRVLVVLVMLAALAVGGWAQSPVPTLSEVDRLRLRNALQAVEIAELRRQAAVADAQRVIQSLQREGYQLDIERMVYVPLPTEEAPTSDE